MGHPNSYALEFTSKNSAQAKNSRNFILATTSDLRVAPVKLADRWHNMAHAAPSQRNPKPRTYRAV